jgi:uncharacterized membrane protein YvlD (DUF360 family)
MPVLRIAPRTLATVLVAALALVVLAELLPGVELRKTWAALAAVILIGLVNSLAWPTASPGRCSSGSRCPSPC